DRLSLFDTPRMRSILSEVIPRTETATGRVRVRGGEEAVFSDLPQRFGRYLEDEGRMIQTRNEMLGNSKTGRRLCDEDAHPALSPITEVFDANCLMAAGRRAAFQAIQRMFGTRQGTAVSMARQLFDADPVRRQQSMEAIIARMGANRAQQLAQY